MSALVKFPRRLLFCQPLSLQFLLMLITLSAGLSWLKEGDTFNLQTYAVLRQIVSENALGAAAVVIAVISFIGMVSKNVRANQIGTLLQTGLFLLLGVTLTIATWPVTSASGMVDIVTSIASAWVFWRVSYE